MIRLCSIFRFFRRSRNNISSDDVSVLFASKAGQQLAQALNTAPSDYKGLTPLENSALKIARLSDAEYIIIAKLSKNNKLKLETIAKNGNILKCGECYLEMEFLPEFFHNRFVDIPEPDALLQSINISNNHSKSGVGVVLTDNEHAPVGAIFGFSKVPAITKALKNTLYFFASNLSSEILHQVNKERLEYKNRELLRTEEELKLKNQLLDNLNQNISKAKQVVDESSRLKSAFLANLSHEIRTPMNVIMGFTELLSADNMTADQRRNYIDIIQQNGTRLLHIMDSLIDISSFQAKNIGKEQQPFSLNQMMKQLCSAYQSDIDLTGKPLELVLSPGTNPGSDVINLDKEATFKTLNHLLDNAVKFTASGFVKLGYEMHPNHIAFFIEDTGIGIPDGKEMEIFDLFRQGDLRLSRHFGGTGLGLAIAKRYITAMNGQIWCTNKKEPEQGSIFRFTIPLISAETQANTALPENNGAAHMMVSPAYLMDHQ
jgi:signal transduction histidine kinase